jgi:hypothetical protein
MAKAGPDALDIESEGGRARAVTATLRASLNRLELGEQERYRELALFGARGRRHRNAD